MSVIEVVTYWIDEAKNRDRNNGIKSGLIKIGLDKIKLSKTCKKLVEAAVLHIWKPGLQSRPLPVPLKQPSSNLPYSKNVISIRLSVTCFGKIEL
jgi:hypothetical protein